MFVHPGTKGPREDGNPCMYKTCGEATEKKCIFFKGSLRGRSHDTGMTFIPERVHSIPIYFSVSVYMIPRRKLGPAQVIPE